jgi:hypothetical protein
VGISVRQRSSSSRDDRPLEETNIRRFRPISPLNYQRRLHSLARLLRDMDQTEAADLLEDQIATVSGYGSSLLSRALRRRDLEPPHGT